MTLHPTHKYDDIIDLPHHISSQRAAMSQKDRAAQFSPFAALTGYDGIIAETGRLTQQDTELTESRIEELNRRLCLLLSRLEEAPEVTVTWFCPDQRKAGGAYLQKTGQLKKLDPYESQLIFTDGTAIAIDSIYAIDGI